jgi:hypothetical protein
MRTPRRRANLHGTGETPGAKASSQRHHCGRRAGGGADFPIPLGMHARRAADRAARRRAMLAAGAASAAEPRPDGTWIMPRIVPGDREMQVLCRSLAPVCRRIPLDFARSISIAIPLKIKAPSVLSVHSMFYL